MRLYRICKRQHANDLSGQGARLYGGRWNHKGTPVIYTASSVALATLEVLVHVPLSIIPRNMVVVTLKVPTDQIFTTVNKKDLPTSWSNYPAPNELAEISTTWARANKTLGLKIPSSILPDDTEFNLLLNPVHPDSYKIEVVYIKNYSFDERLFRPSC